MRAFGIIMGVDDMVLYFTSVADSFVELARLEVIDIYGTVEVKDITLSEIA